MSLQACADGIISVLISDAGQKYAVVGAGVAALGGTVLGTALPWVSMLVLPSIPVAAAMGVTTAAIKVLVPPRSFL